MSYPVSACCFIRNTFKGAFMLPETMAQFLPLVKQMIIVDLGSDDGTREFLDEVSDYPKIEVVYRDEFPFTDANVFATLANELIGMCRWPHVIYWQADEVWHEDLLKLMTQRFEAGQFDLSFWRIQYANNFQYVKWFPQLVHRVGIKGSNLNEGKNNFEFDGDGMNTTRMWDAKICSTYGGEMFPLWGSFGQDGIKPYVNEMITDVSLLGGFRDNIPDRRRMHAPFWHEEPDIPYFDYVTKQQPRMSESEWLKTALADPDWTKESSPYNLPAILRYHVGKVRYELRPDLLQALKDDTTWNYIQNLG